MLWILLVVGILGAIITFFFAIVAMFTDWSDALSYAIDTIIFFSIGSLGFFGLSGINSLSYDETVKTSDWQLVSITDNNQIFGKSSGGLFYIRISIDTDEVYSFYYKVDNGGFKRGTVNAENSTIFEKDDCTPHIVEYTTYTKNKMNVVLRTILAFGYGTSSQKSYEIYTPTGTILRTFSLDSQ